MLVLKSGKNMSSLMDDEDLACTREISPVIRQLWCMVEMV